MGFDSSIKSEINSSSILKAEHINKPIDEINKFINKGIGRSELKSKTAYKNLIFEPFEYDGWVNSNLIFKPEFYGSPAPRMMAVSGQSHYRERTNNWAEGAIFNADANGLDFVGIPGSCTTIKLRHSAIVNVMASFYMFEFGGVNKAPRESVSTARIDRPQKGGILTDARDLARSSTNNSFGYESRVAGKVRLIVDGQSFSTTTRRIFTSTVEPARSTHLRATGQNLKFKFVQRGFVTFSMIGRHQHNIIYQMKLSEGTHHIGLGFRGQSSNEYEIQNQVSAVRFANQDPEGQFVDTYAVERATVPKLTDKKNVFSALETLLLMPTIPITTRFDYDKTTCLVRA